MDGDIVVQVPDLNHVNVDPGLQAAVQDYFWSADETLGFYEGGAGMVVSVVPGVGALANGMPLSSQHMNAVPHPVSSLRIDEGGLTRTTAPTAGAVTHYHNFTFVWHKDVAAGHEVLVHYGASWFQVRHEQGVPLATTTTTAQHADNNNGTTVEYYYQRPVPWLREHGQCLDHLQVASQSQQEYAGRGAVARHNLRRGTIVAPMPLLALHRASLQRRSLEKQDGTVVETPPQLLLNYCLGHSESSLLLFPYSSMVK